MGLEQLQLVFSTFMLYTLQPLLDTCIYTHTQCNLHCIDCGWSILGHIVHPKLNYYTTLDFGPSLSNTCSHKRSPLYSLATFVDNKTPSVCKRAI